MEQYISIKKNYEDCILFFRLGDFYEMFFDDAKLGSKELELTLTGKNCGQEERAPMCGVPFHSAESYIAKLVDKGYKVAICEQVEDPASAKGIVKREVIQVEMCIRDRYTSQQDRCAYQGRHKSRSVFRQSYRLNDKRSGKIFREPRNSLSDSRRYNGRGGQSR